VGKTSENGTSALGWAVAAIGVVTLPNLCAMILPGADAFAAMVAMQVAALMLIPCAFGAPLRIVLLAGIPFVWLGPVAILCRITTGQPPSEWFFLLLFETTRAEATVFLPQILSGCALLLACSAVFAWIVWRRLDRRTRLDRLGRMTIVFWALLAPAAAVAQLGLREGGLTAAYRLENSYPLDTALSLVRAAGLRWELSHRARSMARIAVRRLEPPLPQREIYLLVIGEAARYDRFQINGYERPTTPRLAGIDGLLSFRDVISPAPATLLAVPMLLTAATAPEAREALRLPSLPAAFRAAGFHVHWLSTQARHGRWDTTVSSFAQDADDARFLGSQLGNEGSAGQTALDTELIPVVRDILARNEQKILLILHTMGSHALYSDRYTPEFDRFPADPTVCAEARRRVLVEGAFTKEQQTALDNSYDNSILFTDSVLADLIGVLEDQHAVSGFYYVSDHGENGGDASYLPFGHGNLSSEVLHIPLLVWLSPEYRAARTRQSAALAEHVAVPISSTTTFHTLFDLAGLGGARSDPAHSIASPEFRPSVRMVTNLHGDLKDYDRDIKASGEAGDNHLVTR